MKFLFKGLSATFTREVPGFAIYFSVFEGLKAKTEFLYSRDISYLEAFAFGGLSGTMAWIFIYPQDRIKTILQANTASNTVNIKVIIKNIYENGGLKHFYKGFSWAVCRAILLHSGTFCMMEMLNNNNIIDLENISF
jgi:solute carrier family 25 carnitine/acylcarnitine transporter 20/29